MLGGGALTAERLVVSSERRDLRGGVGSTGLSRPDTIGAFGGETAGAADSPLESSGVSDSGVSDIGHGLNQSFG